MITATGLLESLTACKIAYLDSGQVQEAGGVLVHGESNGGGYVAEAVVLPGSRGPIVAFRGTEPGELRDLLADLRPFRGKLGTIPGGFRRGFLRALTRVAPELSGAVHAVGGGEPPAVITGHSMGGALATVYSGYLALGGRHGGTKVITFAAPRSASPRASRWLEWEFAGRFWRIEFPLDLVPKVPPSWFGYRHVGELIKAPLKNNHSLEALEAMVLYLERKGEIPSC